MTEAEAITQAVAANDQLPAGYIAKTIQTIGLQFEYNWGVIVIDNLESGNYDAADTLTKALYGQAYIYAMTQAPVGNAAWLTAFNNKLTELLA